MFFEKLRYWFNRWAMLIKSVTSPPQLVVISGKPYVLSKIEILTKCIITGISNHQSHCFWWWRELQLGPQWVVRRIIYEQEAFRQHNKYPTRPLLMTLRQNVFQSQPQPHKKKNILLHRPFLKLPYFKYVVIQRLMPKLSPKIKSVQEYYLG